MADDGHLHKDTKRYLQVLPRTARFYYLPKIHNPPLPKGTIPGRPIVSCGAPVERISEYVDHHLQHLVGKTLSYLKDTANFLNKVATLGTLLPGCILVTLEVSSLYTNIPHDGGMEACRRALDTHQSPDPPTSYLIWMMEQILTLINFSFNGNH